MLPPTLTSIHALTIDIGEIPILVRTDNPEFAHMLEDRYGEFVTADAPHAVMELEIELVKEPGLGVGTRDGSGIRGSRTTMMPTGPERASGGRTLGHGAGRLPRGMGSASHRGWVRQSANPYAIDGVLRILHSLILAREGGFLVHAASAVRNGRAFVFAGVSGAGKTTLARLAPPDVTLLTDEISYVRDTGYGTRDTGQVQESGDRSQDSGVRIRIQETGVGIANRQSKSQIANHQSRIANC